MGRNTAPTLRALHKHVRPAPDDTVGREPPALPRENGQPKAIWKRTLWTYLQLVCPLRLRPRTLSENTRRATGPGTERDAPEDGPGFPTRRKMWKSNNCVHGYIRSAGFH